jgi:oxygen-independent coproporphyrinogen III oxidase
MAGIYIHIPFCEKKCIYCDFYSEANHNDRDIFIQFLIKEIEMNRQYFSYEEIETIYFGGGTPSLLEPKQVDKILSVVNNNFKVRGGAEITFEVNPGTVDEQKLSDYKQIGINRLSIGIQSLDEKDLVFLTRIHNAADALRCYESARTSGFENISIDLIFGLPTQTINSWQKVLDQATGLKPQHISAYNLIVEEGTPLFRLVDTKQISKQSEDIETQMFEDTISNLTSAGYRHYEVSNYALPDFESRHNNNYWNYTNYFGFGPSAHSFLDGKRWWNVRSIFSYYSRIDNGILPVEGEETLDRSQQISELIMLGLRSKGVNIFKLKNDLDFDFLKTFDETINLLIETRLGTLNGEYFSLTKKGILISDEISRKLISQPASF